MSFSVIFFVFYSVTLDGQSWWVDGEDNCGRNKSSWWWLRSDDVSVVWWWWPPFLRVMVAMFIWQENLFTVKGGWGKIIIYLYYSPHIHIFVFVLKVNVLNIFDVFFYVPFTYRHSYPSRIFILLLFYFVIIYTNIYSSPYFKVICRLGVSLIAYQLFVLFCINWVRYLPASCPTQIFT